LLAQGTEPPAALGAYQGVYRVRYTVISRLKEAGVRTRHAAVKKLLTDEHKLYRLTFAESNADRVWDRVTFCVESTHSCAKDEPVYFTDCGESVTTVSMCRVSFHSWD
jgi:hypothetical protein